MLPKRVLYYGKEEDLPARVDLRAGPLALVYEQGDLRTIRLGNREVVRRIYVAVRDRNWGTVAPVLSNATMQVNEDSFLITYDAENHQGDIVFTWKASIRGEADGTITFTMDGEARSTFWRNRIGFCILHPAELSGQPAQVEHVDGSWESAVFPVDFVASQPVSPFAEMRAVTHAVTPGVRVEICFSGDIFEMEDQRNWTDASYKIFSTPLRLPYPVEIQKGSRVSQSVRLRLFRDPPAPIRAPEAESRVEESPSLAIERGAVGLPLPQLGLGLASHGLQLDEVSLARLRHLNLHHLRVDLDPGSPHVRVVLAQAAEQARALGVGLEAALFVPEDADTAMAAFRRVVEALEPPVVSWLCFPAEESFRGGSPVAQAVAAARGALANRDPQIPFCAGTNTDFIFLKRSVPPLEQTARVTFAICPQVHAFDNASLVETLPVQGDAVRSAGRISQGRPVMVSPVTLKMRFNPYVTGIVTAPAPGELPPQVDARQMSLFGAGWTLGSFKYLSEAGAASVTYYETSGWRGVLETGQGSPLPAAFRSLPGCVFPMYHVFADIGAFAAAGSLLPVKASHPQQVSGVCLRMGAAERLLLANHTPKDIAVRVSGALGSYTGRFLDETTTLEAMQSPEPFRARLDQVITAKDGWLVVELKPFALARLDHLEG